MASVSTSTGTPIDKLINQTAAAPANSSSALSSQLGQDAFLKLLTTQLQNQNPLQPMDETQSIAQLAQFSSVSSISQLSDKFAAFQSNFSVMQSAGLIGKTVAAQTTDGNGNSITVNGTVKTISVINGQPQITLVGADGKLLTGANGAALQIPTANILSIGQ